MWTSYTAAADGIVFVIDMTDVSRLDILRTTFHGVLDTAGESLRTWFVGVLIRMHVSCP